MNFAIVSCVLVLLTSVNVGASNDELYGTWRLLSFIIKDVSTDKTTDTFGKTPHGFINYSRDGRMLVLIVKDERPKPDDLAKMTDTERVDLFKTLISYGGTYTFDGKTVTHHIDISWNENWTGTDQVRNVKFEGSKLILSTNPQVSPIDGKLGIGVLTWEKVE